jgi:hypothetical protein
MNVKTLSFLLMMLACNLPTLARAGTTELTPAETAVTPRVAVDGTTYYSVAISLPAGLTSVTHAQLEFRADISARDLTGYLDPAPVLDVYALKEALRGDPDPSKFEATRLPMSRPVAAGADRLVKIDITDFVRMILGDPSKNHGLVLGPLTADKRGIFTIKQDGLGDGITARVRILER